MQRGVVSATSFRLHFFYTVTLNIFWWDCLEIPVKSATGCECNFTQVALFVLRNRY